MTAVRTALAAILAVVLLVAGILGYVLTGSDPSRSYAEGVRVGIAPLEVPCGDRVLELPARWSFPPAAAEGLVWMQHGFARSGERMADLADRLAVDGMLVVAPTAGALGDCSLGDAEALLPGIASVLATSTDASGALAASARIAAEDAGIALDRLPEALVLTGHSAGGAAMVGVAAALAERQDAASRRLRVVLLLDPVESRAGVMAGSLGKLADVEVLAIAGEPGACNANGSGPSVLAERRGGFLGVRLDGGCHCDAEGASTNVACTLVCGASDPADVATLQSLARAWVGDAIDGTRGADLSPGGAELRRLVDEGAVRLLEG